MTIHHKRDKDGSFTDDQLISHLTSSECSECVDAGFRFREYAAYKNGTGNRLYIFMHMHWVLTHTKDHEYFGIAQLVDGEDDGLRLENVTKCTYATPDEAIGAAIERLGAWQVKR